MQDRIPNDEEWEDSSTNLDGWWSRKTWQGIDVREIERRLRDGEVEIDAFINDLQYMPQKPFNYYLPAVLNVIKEPVFCFDAPLASIGFINVETFLCFVKRGLQSNIFGDSLKNVRETVEFFEKHLTYFEDPQDINKLSNLIADVKISMQGEG